MEEKKVSRKSLEIQVPVKLVAPVVSSLKTISTGYILQQRHLVICKNPNVISKKGKFKLLKKLLAGFIEKILENIKPKILIYMALSENSFFSASNRCVLSKRALIFKRNHFLSVPVSIVMSF